MNPATFVSVWESEGRLEPMAPVALFGPSRLFLLKHLLPAFIQKRETQKQAQQALTYPHTHTHTHTNKHK